MSRVQCLLSWRDTKLLSLIWAEFNPSTKSIKTRGKVTRFHLLRKTRKCFTEKARAPHSSTLAWKIPWMEEPGRLQSMGVAKSRTRLSDFTFTFHFHALEKEMATPSSVLAWRIPGTGSLVGCRLWGRTESDTTEVT